MNKIVKILIHSIFWIVFLTYTISAGEQMGRMLNIDMMLPHLFINTIWAGVAFYLSYGYVINYFEKSSYFKYLVVSVSICLLCAIVFLPFHFLIKSSFNWLNIQLAAGSVVGTFIIGQCGSLIRGFENWIDNLKIQAEIENRRLRTENELLKSQISPHFLFNTLNNIDSFIHTAPQKASDTLISLSEILRYMIYETKADMVPFSKEIECVKNYLDLQKIRISHPDAIKISLPKDFPDVNVAPLIFLPFVENVFKHAANKDEKGAIEITIKVEDQKIMLRCFNTFIQKELNPHNGGFGLENVKRRLEFLYRERHSLIINKTQNTFEVILFIDI